MLSCPVAQADMPDGDELMQQLRASLPSVPLKLTGELQSRNRRGDIMRVSPIEMVWDWSGPYPRMEYVVRDRFGSELGRARMQWPLEDDAAWDQLLQPLPGLDVKWADLMLSFLWWDGATVIGSERIRGRFCYVLDVPAPAGVRNAYAGVRIWLDPDSRLLMQADAYDRRNTVTRRLQVKSIRKIDDLWMVQNLEIVNPETRERITLRIQDVQELDDSAVLD